MFSGSDSEDSMTTDEDEYIEINDNNGMLGKAVLEEKGPAIMLPRQPPVPPTLDVVDDETGDRLDDVDMDNLAG